MTNRGSIAIVGGGITGLAAALEGQKAGFDVQIYESSDTWGGKIFSSPVGDRLVDAGPDTFLARAPEGVALCEELGLTDQLVAPVSPVPAYIHKDRRLFPLPTGTVLGIPTDFEVLKQSGLVSSEGIDRAEQDLTLPPTPIPDDCSLGWYCRQRLGDEVTERLIDPLLGGINASNIDDLSLEAAFPALASVARSHTSLITGLRQRQKSIGATLGSAKTSKTSKPAPVFYSLPGGMAHLIEVLVDRLQNPPSSDQQPVRLFASQPVDDLAALDCDAAVLAAPAPTSAQLVHGFKPVAAELLRTLQYTSVAQVTFELPIDGVNPVLDASGILFPRSDGLTATAATWLSTKWDHYHRDDHVLIRVTSGRANDRRPMDIDDETLTKTLLADVATVVDVSTAPTATRVKRWPNALPQYKPGHQMLVQKIRTELNDSSTRNPANLTAVAVAGATYDGIGIPACIRSGRSAIEKLARDLQK